MLLSHVARVASGFRRVCPDQREMRERETGPLGFSWYTCFLIREMESGRRSRAVCTYQLEQQGWLAGWLYNLPQSGSVVGSTN